MTISQIINNLKLHGLPETAYQVNENIITIRDLIDSDRINAWQARGATVTVEHKTKFTGRNRPVQSYTITTVQV